MLCEVFIHECLFLFQRAKSSWSWFQFTGHSKKNRTLWHQDAQCQGLNHFELISLSLNSQRNLFKLANNKELICLAWWWSLSHFQGYTDTCKTVGVCWTEASGGQYGPLNQLLCSSQFRPWMNVFHHFFSFPGPRRSDLELSRSPHGCPRFPANNQNQHILVGQN